MERAIARGGRQNVQFCTPATCRASLTAIALCAQCAEMSAYLKVMSGKKYLPEEDQKVVAQLQRNALLRVAAPTIGSAAAVWLGVRNVPRLAAANGLMRWTLINAVGLSA